MDVQGFESGPDIDSNSRLNEVGPGYLGTLGIPLLVGREFTDADALGTTRVAIVNETFARKFNLGRRCSGQVHVQRTQARSNVEIVGLMKDAEVQRGEGHCAAAVLHPVAAGPRRGR